MVQSFSMKYPVKFEIELRKNPYPGRYIALEGIDGSGKTTQAKLLSDYFISQGKKVLLTAEPTRKGEVGGLIDRALKKEVKINRKFFQYLFSADRGIHQEEEIIPALKKGTIVIADRCYWSSLTYGILDKISVDGDKNYDQLLVAYSILSLYHQFITPDVTFFLDTNVDLAMKRLNSGRGAKEIYEKRAFVTSVAEIYEWITKKFKTEFVRIDGNNHVDDVSQLIIKAL